MTTTLRVVLEIDGHPVRAYQKEITEPYVDAFRPVDVCDDAVVAMAAPGGHTKGSVQRVRVRRRNYAQLLAGHISDAIVYLMENNDMHNGYPIKEEAR